MKHGDTLNDVATFLVLSCVLGVLFGRTPGAYAIGLIVSFVITWTIREYYKTKKKDS